MFAAVSELSDNLPHTPAKYRMHNILENLIALFSPPPHPTLEPPWKWMFWLVVIWRTFFFTNAMGLTNFCSTERVFYLFTLFKISQLKSVSFFLRVLSKGEKRRTGDIKKSFVKNSDIRALQKIQWYSFRTADLAFFAAPSKAFSVF